MLDLGLMKKNFLHTNDILGGKLNVLEGCPKAIVLFLWFTTLGLGFQKSRPKVDNPFS